MASRAGAGDDGSVEHPDRWRRDRRRDRWRGELRPDGQWHRGPWHRGPFGLRHGVGHGGPLRRDPEDRLGGGVAAGLAAWKGLSVTTVRLVFVLLALLGGWFVPVYVAAWLLLPTPGAESIGSRARSDARGIRLAIGLASLLTLVLVAVSALNGGWLVRWAWPQVFSVAGLVLVWRNGAAQERAALRRLIEPLENAANSGGRRWAVLRVALAGVLLVGGVYALVSGHKSLALLRPLGGAALVIAAIVLVLGPWWLRIGRDLLLERQARIRAEERADIAARVHDSVLQTLALIQRRAEDPQKVIQLARLQERELRSWLFEGKGPNEPGEELTVAGGIRQIQQDVEASYGVPVEAVTVGDCDLDDSLGALVAAAREATVNAAKWSGAGVISLFAEVEPGEVSAVVRDKGKGFDPEAVPEDRKGLAESVRGRMSRRGGTATVTSAPGEGTKVTLKMPRAVPAGRP